MDSSEDLRAGDVARHGWAHGRLPLPTEGDDWQHFTAAWDDLVPDAYLGPARCRRNRRYGRVLAHRDGTLEPLLGTEFFQSKQINRAFGDQLRVFEPLTDKALTSCRFSEILQESVGLVNEAAGDRDWELGVHFIRVIAEPDEGSEPAPEGRHSDGHEYVAIHLIGRHHCVGGESQVFRRGEERVEHRVTMTEPLEALVLSDTTMEHAVSEIRTEDRSVPGWRDTMIVDFNTVQDLAEVNGRTHSSLQALSLF
ncbi:2OG-Fe dioxygenase family protein [Dactylosporangium sp. NPDC050588]|uniref:2OG-Fe dioxygenase family protein n=1 Tax=Dactylosporangium sp. NPDC050588 TaxID=3157211 RepID=UPI0033EBF11E